MSNYDIVRSMERLRKLRETFRFTQSDIAKMVGVSQQAVARWENGNSEPSIASLRDLAVIFGTSVDDLVGSSDSQKRIVSNHYTGFFDDDIDGFWGHLGLHLPNVPQVRWYPITRHAAHRIRGAVEDEPWLAIATLNDRMLLFRPSCLKRLSLLDEAADEPDNGWNLDWDAEQGFSLEIYSALEQKLYRDSEYEESTSPKLREVVESVIKDSGLSDDELLTRITCTLLIDTDGTEIYINVEPENLYDAVFNAELGDVEVFSLQDGNGHERFYSSRFVSLIDIPLRQFDEGAKKILEELKAE